MSLRSLSSALRGFHVGALRQLVTESSTSTLQGYQVRSSVLPSERLTGANLEMLPEKINWKRLWADGVTPYQGILMGVKDYGAVIALSQTQKGLVPATKLKDRHLGSVETPLTVYIISKTFDNQRLRLALDRAETPMQRLERLKCDGRTPYRGTVTSVASFGVFVDIGFERSGFLPQRELPSEATLQAGDEVTVYVPNKHWRSGRFNVSLQPLQKPHLPKRLLQVDGLTPYQGIVRSLAQGVAVIDFGFDVCGTLQDVDDLEIGSELTVYAVRRLHRSRRVWLSRRPLVQPLLTLKEVVADGQLGAGLTG